MWKTYSVPCLGQTLPGTSVMPATSTCRGLRISMTKAAPSSPKRPESVSKMTISRAAAGPAIKMHIISGRIGSSRYGRSDEGNDGVERGAGLKDGRHATFLEGLGIRVRYGPAKNDLDVVHLMLAEQLHHLRHDRVMGPGQDGQADHL